jgi:streptogramin lyase
VLVLLAWGSRQPEPADGVGQHSVLRVDDGGLVPVAASNEAYDALLKAAAAHDTVGEAALVAASVVSAIPSGTQVLVIDRGAHRRQVRVESGNLVGQTVWVSSDYIARR